MLNIGGGEIALILVVALLVLGPRRLPELARGIGKFLREFRRQTDEVRSTLETEFYRMDQDLLSDAPKSPVAAPVPTSAHLPSGMHSAPATVPFGGAPVPTLTHPSQAPRNTVVDDDAVVAALSPEAEAGHSAFAPAAPAAPGRVAPTPVDAAAAAAPESATAPAASPERDRRS